MKWFRKESTVPTLAASIFVAIFLYICLFIGNGLFTDGDTGYHIRVGERILDTRSVPHTDPYSFTTPALPWTAHGWLSEVIMALAYRSFGLTGVGIFFGALIALIYFLLFQTLRSQTTHITRVVVAIVFAVAASQIHWFARPHLFSHLMFIVWYFLLDSYQTRQGRSIRTLPLWMLLWVNLHGGFIIGFVLLGVFLAGNAISARGAEGEGRQSALRKVKEILSTTSLCVLTATVNPYGWRILLFPFNLVSDSYLMDHVSEFLSPNFHNPLVTPFRLIFLLMIVLLCLSREKLSAIETIILLGFTNMAFASVRHIPMFVFAVAPILLRHAESLTIQRDGAGHPGFLHRKAAGIASIDRAAGSYIWMAGAILGVLIYAQGGRIEYTFDPAVKPVAAVEFLKREPIPGNMFNNDEFGDYIIYAAGDDYDVFIDGRLDMYGAKRLKEYFQVRAFEAGWEKVIDAHRIGWIVDESKSALVQYLRKDDKWHLIYADPVASIFVKNIPEYRHLIDKYGNVAPALTNDT